MAEIKNYPHITYDYEKPDFFSIDPMKPLIEQIMTDFRIQQEDHIMKAVSDVGISVDKPRLLQALTDAKDFYEEGYRAAMNRADVVEVRHGEWDWYPNRIDRQELLCTNCEEPAPYNEDGERVRTPYCPNCGAKMDGKG